MALTLSLTACDNTPGKSKRNRSLPNEGFTQAETVRITAPSNGAVVQDRFTVEVETGRDVDTVTMRADGAEIRATFIDDGDHQEAIIRLTEGEHELEVQGIATDGSPLTTHAVTIRVESPEEEDWVMVTSPRDGATVTNPVAFAVRASSAVDTIEVFADDWSLGTTTPEQILTYEFSGTGFERHIEAVGYDDGVEIARTDLTISVSDGSAPADSPVNNLIMSILADYPTDGTYDYWWPDDSHGWGGNPHDIFYGGQLFAPGDAELRSYCVGITFEVFMRTFDQLDTDYDLGGDLNGVSFDELYELRTDWYVRDLYGMGIVDAMDNYGIGQRVSSWDDVQPGDIIQFWRHSGSGHNAIFIGWEVDGNGEVTGFTYWSTQGSTDGIGYNDEYFGTSGSRVDPSFFFAGRLAPPEDWSPWW
jgi:hypothetical protein